MLRRSRLSSFSLYSFASSPFFATSSKLKKERYNLMALTTRKVRASVPAREKATHTPLLPSSRKYIWLALNYLLMSLLAIFFLFPIVFMIISSLKADENQLLEDVTTLRAFIPYGDLSLQNYNDAFQRFPFGLYLFNFDIPKDIEEAAFVDGASHLRIYWQLVVPLSRSVFITVAIWQFLIHIGDFLWPLMVTRGNTYRPVMVGMRVFFAQSPLHWGDIMAFASMITIFMLIVFLLFQRWFLRSVASAGITG